MWMRNPYNMVTTLILGEYKYQVPGGPSVMCTSNGGRHSECAEVNGKLLTEYEYLTQYSDRYEGDTKNKLVWRFLN